MYAVIRTGGKQYRVNEGDEILVEKLVAKEGEVVRFDDVVAVRDDSGVKTGDEARAFYVEAEVLGFEKGEKIIVFKYRPKKRYRRKTGHRQNYTRIKILKIASLEEGRKKRSAKEKKEELKEEGS
jgi:large subunit ribosomal protein L21